MSTNHLQETLIPDYIDNEDGPNTNVTQDNGSAVSADQIYSPSFIDIRHKTLRSLYGIEDFLLKDVSKEKVNHALLMDKSPKGSVDEAIRSLVDLINAHPSYATLSSCSGRISLFDPNYASMQNVNNDNYENVNEDERTAISNSDNNTNTGKGYGAWIITSHAQITPNDLRNGLDTHHTNQKTRSTTLDTGTNSDCSYALMFKHEPLLLHIAACNIKRARQLLTLAYNLGFRESGLVVTPKRITVAIRSHSLSLAVPIASSGMMRPNDEYLNELVREANERFCLNEKKLIALEEEVKNNLFQRNISGGSSREPLNHLDLIDATSFAVEGHPLPDLNLWGHSAISIPTPSSDNDNIELLVFGGYGAGPVKSSQNTNSNAKHKFKCSRMDKAYSLKRRDKIWDDSWQEVQQQNNDDLGEEVFLHGIKLKRVSFTAREGHSSCILPLDKMDLKLGLNSKSNSDSNENISFIATFGGRASPSRPNNELLLTPCHCRPISFFSPMDIRGSSPSARWGHSFTALSGIGGQVGIVIGGRDEKNVFDSIHVLSCVGDTDSNRLENVYFQWDKIDLLESIPRFHHTSVLIASSSEEEDEQKIIVFGGLQTLQLFGNNMAEKNYSTIILKKDKTGSMNSIKDSSASCFGASTCLLSTNKCVSERKHLILSSGGLLCDESNEESQSSMNLICCTLDKSHVDPIKKVDCKFDDSNIDLGSLVHHITLNVSCKNVRALNVVSLGGGVPSFAFGQSFAKSYILSIDTQSGMDNGSNLRKIQSQSNKQTRPAKVPSMKSNGKGSNCTDVLYVMNRKAKEVKVALENLGFLDRNFRMKKADDSAPFEDITGLIAIPITRSCLELFTSSPKEDSSMSWISLVEGMGKQEVPYSTAVLGRK